MKTLPVSLLFAAFLLGGCGLFTADRPVLQMDYAGAFLVYADTLAAYSVAKVRIVDACAAKVLPDATCQELSKADDRLQITNKFIRDGLSNPINPIDWGKVQAFSSEVLGILVQVGVKGLVP